MRPPPTDDEVLAQMRDFYTRAGLGPAEAQQAVAAQLARLMTLWPGTEYGGLFPEDLGLMWRLARQQGARRLVLEVAADADATVTVRVVERTDDTPPEEAAPANLRLR